ESSEWEHWAVLLGSRGRPGHELLAQGWRELEWLERPVVEDAAQHGRDDAARDCLAGVGELEGVADGGAADALGGDADLDHVLEADGAEIVATGVDAGESDGVALPLGEDGQATGAEVGVLGGLHEAEEIGEVYDAGHVGFGELDETGESEGHEIRS